jgi:hypothetical protein
LKVKQPSRNEKIVPAVLFYFQNLGRVTPHGQASGGRVMSLQSMTANQLPSQNERQTMHLLCSPVFASALYIGGGGVGLLLIIVIVVLLVR